MNWNPHTLQQCLDSDLLGYLTAFLALGMLVWYIAIAIRWYESLQRADKGGKAVWGWLVALFIVCAMAGYVALILALWLPKTSVLFRLVFLVAQNFVCPIFWTLARKYKFNLYGAYQHIGENLCNNQKIETMSDHELATMTRTLVITALGRTAEKLVK